MMSKIFSTISLVGVIGLIWYEYLQVIHAQQKLQTFVAAGPRFTAADGQELCLVVAELAKESYGYRASGKPVPVCNYYVEKDKNKLK